MVGFNVILWWLMIVAYLFLGHPVHHIHMQIKTLKYSITRLKYYYGILLKTKCSHFQRKLHFKLYNYSVVNN